MSNKKNRKGSSTEDSIRFNTNLTGKPAQQVQKWLKEGTYTTYAECLRAAVQALYEKHLENEYREHAIKKGNY